METNRTCEWCGESFAARSSRSRFCSKSCRYKSYYHSHPEYRQAQIENSIRRVKTSAEAHTNHLESMHRWREAHREESREATRRWYRNNKDRCAQISKAWWNSHPEKRKEYRDKWKEENPERIRAFWRDNTIRRRALKASADGNYSYADFLDLCERSEWQCAYCGQQLDPETATADHMVPLSRGGSNDIENIALSCQSCNSSKHDKTVEEFLASRSIEEVHH